MGSRVSAEVRRTIVARAERLCEYCLIHEDDTFFGCQVDHVISEKHGGPTSIDNLAYAGMFCNVHKGSDIGSIVQQTGQFCRFFDPRKDRWSEHFELRDEVIAPLTEVGAVTVRILGFNSSDRLLERRALIDLRRYPSPAALRHMAK